MSGCGCGKSSAPCVPGKGERGLTGARGPQGDPGPAGPSTRSGRGIAVFVQNVEPDQNDFNSAYGTIEGFGVNGITGSDQIKAGDLWIDVCA